MLVCNFAAVWVCNPISRKGILENCGIKVSPYSGIAGDRGDRGLLRAEGSADRLFFLARFSVSQDQEGHRLTGWCHGGRCRVFSMGVDKRRQNELIQFALINRSVPLREAAAALKHMHTNAHFGKIVLTACPRVRHADLRRARAGCLRSPQAASRWHRQGAK